MCGPYNHPEKGNMTLSAQAAFCGFYTSILAQHHVGWAVLVAVSTSAVPVLVYVHLIV